MSITFIYPSRNGTKVAQSGHKKRKKYRRNMEEADSEKTAKWRQKGDKHTTKSPQKKHTVLFARAYCSHRKSILFCSQKHTVLFARHFFERIFTLSQIRKLYNQYQEITTQFRNKKSLKKELKKEGKKAQDY